MAKQSSSPSLFQRELVGTAIRESFVKLSPSILIKNPVMFTVEIGTVVMVLVTAYIATTGDTSQGSLGYNIAVTAILLLTILFANFAEAIAEARGKAQAESLRKTRQETPAKVVRPVGNMYTNEVEIISSAQLAKGDIFLCEPGDIIPADGEIIEGLATIDESAITGESAPVIREAGGDKSSVTGGTKVLSDRIKVQVTTQPGESFLDKMIALVEGASRQKTPNEIALTILLAGFTLIFIIVCVALKPFADYANTYTYLLNGVAPAGNWTGLFRPGEKVLLRFINGSSMTYFDIRIPGLRMTVVAADGQYVHPVSVDELRIAAAETFDVLVEPIGQDAFTLFAQDMGRTGFACGTLAVRHGLQAPIPALDPRAILTMQDMGHGDGMAHAGHAMHGADTPHSDPHAAHAMAMPMPAAQMHGHASGDAQRKTPHHPASEDGNPLIDMRSNATSPRLDDPGVGLRDNGRRVLRYADLHSLFEDPDGREPGREIELHLTGHMLGAPHGRNEPVAAARAA